MKGLPSGPLTFPVIVAANAGDSGPVSKRETSTLFAQRMTAPVVPARLP
jgi:hypothetical protein